MKKIIRILVFLGFVLLNVNCEPNAKSNDQKIKPDDQNIKSNPQKGYHIIFGNEGENGIPILNNPEQIEIEKEVIEKRLKSYGFSSESFNIKIEKGTDIKDYKIVLKVETNDSLKQITSLVRTVGKLEFRETWNFNEAFPYLVKLDSVLKEKKYNSDNTLEKNSDGKYDLQEVNRLHPLFAILMISNPNTTAERGSSMLEPKIGVSHLDDTAKVNSFLSSSEANSLLPSGMKFKWTNNASLNKNNSYCELIAIKELLGQKAPLGSDQIAVNNKFNASLSFRKNEEAKIEINMNKEATETWAKLTKDNRARYIVIIIDDHVYIYAEVIGEIPDGKCFIPQDNLTENRLKVLAAVINGGELHLPIISIKE